MLLVACKENGYARGGLDSFSSDYFLLISPQWQKDARTDIVTESISSLGYVIMSGFTSHKEDGYARGSLCLFIMEAFSFLFYSS